MTRIERYWFIPEKPETSWTAKDTNDGWNSIEQWLENDAVISNLADGYICYYRILEEKDERSV